MRKIITKDVFKLSRIIAISNCEDNFKEIIESVGKKSAEEIGVTMFKTLLSVTSNEKAELLIYELIGDITGKTAEDVANQGFDVTIADIKEIAKNNDLASFFKSVDASL